MSGEIKKVAVIGAGVMGSGIAAQVANAGVPVVLLDMPTESGGSRSALAEGAVARMKKTEPAPLMHARNARLISTGNLEDDFELIAECDWIVEVVIERVDIKRDLYARLETIRKPGSVVSSNTSTIPLANLIEGLPESFQRDFMITHFFNPPRYMRLLEVVDGPLTRPEASAMLRDFCDRGLGKGVVTCKDTPGFIGNRIGVYWMQAAVSEAFEMGVTVEEADALISRPAGIPKTGVFGLADLVGIDLMPHILKSMDATLGDDDPAREYFHTPDLVVKMIEDGYTGRKGKGGFYRLNREGGKKVKEAIDLQSGEYHPVQKPSLKALDASRSGGLRAMLSGDDLHSRYAFNVLGKTLAYAARLVPEIADDIHAVDTAMKLGYGWSKGPFELIDEVGASWLAQALADAGLEVPGLLKTAGERNFYKNDSGKLEFLGVDGSYAPVVRADGVELLSDIKLAAGKPVKRNGSASLWDLGDGVLGLEFHGKMNAIDPQVMAMISTAIELCKTDFNALVIHNEGDNFSVGANIGLALFAANTAAWSQIEEMVKLGQDTYRALKYAPFPVVGAPSGMALGGGCEVLLHCDALVAHAETYMGLVEVGVGLIPGWGGCTEMLDRWQNNPRAPKGPMPAVSKVFETISMAAVAKSAAQAKDYLFLRPDDEIVMNRDRVLASAKARALAMVEGYKPPQSEPTRLPGATAKTALDMAVDGFVKVGKATRHDQVVADALATVLTGGDSDMTDEMSEDDVLGLERSAFMQLVRHPDTLARVEHMLETGRPLRN